MNFFILLIICAIIGYIVYIAVIKKTDTDTSLKFIDDINTIDKYEMRTINNSKKTLPNTKYSIGFSLKDTIDEYTTFNILSRNVVNYYIKKYSNNSLVFALLNDGKSNIPLNTNIVVAQWNEYKIGLVAGEVVALPVTTSSILTKASKLKGTGNTASLYVYSGSVDENMKLYENMKSREIYSYEAVPYECKWTIELIPISKSSSNKINKIKLVFTYSFNTNTEIFTSDIIDIEENKKYISIAYCFNNDIITSLNKYLNFTVNKINITNTMKNEKSGEIINNYIMKNIIYFYYQRRSYAVLEAQGKRVEPLKYKTLTKNGFDYLNDTDTPSKGSIENVRYIADKGNTLLATISFNNTNIPLIFADYVSYLLSDKAINSIMDAFEAGKLY